MNTEEIKKDIAEETGIKTVIVAPQPPPQNDIMNIIDKVMQNPDFDVNKLERLLEMQERIMKKNAEIAFNSALTRLSADLPRIVKKSSVKYAVDKNNPNGEKKEAFKFASYDDIDEVLRPLLSREGFHPSFDTAPRPGDGGGAVITCTLSHVAGHSMKASVPVALDTSGGKNNIQAMGSTISYGKRYALCMLLNIVTCDEDDDGNKNSVVSEAQVAAINALIKTTGSDLNKFLAFAGADTVENINASEYDRVVNMLTFKTKQPVVTTIKNVNETTTKEKK